MISDPDRVRTLLSEAAVPAVPQVTGPVGMAWLRAHVPRFTDGPEHARRRALLVAELEKLSPADLREQVRAIADRTLPHIEVLLKALGVKGIPVTTVDTIARHYQPHEPHSPEADAAVVQLVSALGGTADDVTAARICILVQSCAPIPALVTHARELATRDSNLDELIARTMREHPPLRSTRRTADGDLVELDIRQPGLGWGGGPHACPGREHAAALAAGILEGTR